MFHDLYASKSNLMQIESEVDSDLPEEFVPDCRAGLRPSEIVQSKLLKLMPDMPIPVSCLHTLRDTRRALATSKG